MTWNSTALLNWLSAWQPFGNFPMHSAFLCAVPRTSRCCLSRGLMRSLHENFGFDPQHSMFVSADLRMAATPAETRCPIMQKRILDAVVAIPGVEAGRMDPLLLNDTMLPTFLPTIQPTCGLRMPCHTIHVSRIAPVPRGGRNCLACGRSFTRHDDKDSPVAVINREFARGTFGSNQAPWADVSKCRMERGLEVVGIAEDGKYGTLTEDPHPAMFLPILQWPANATWMVVRSSRDPQELRAAIGNALHQVDAGIWSRWKGARVKWSHRCLAPRWQR